MLPESNHRMTPSSASAQVGVDALMLANGAEVQNGLVYVLGGAWSRCWPTRGRGYPYERTITVVVVFRVPWSETDVQQKFRVSVQDEGSRQVGDPVEGAFIAGRQPDLTPGASQVVVAAVPCRVQLPRKGLYDVVVDLNDVEVARIQFEATELPTRARS